MECTLNAVSQGEKIAYCHDAVTYDEQPCRMSVSVTQRIRWIRGYLEAVFANRQRIVSALFRRGGFAVYDFMMNFAPFIGTLLCIALEVVKVYLLRAAGADGGYRSRGCRGVVYGAVRHGRGNIDRRAESHTLLRRKAVAVLLHLPAVHALIPACQRYGNSPPSPVDAYSAQCGTER